MTLVIPAQSGNPGERHRACGPWVLALRGNDQGVLCCMKVGR